VTAVIAAATLAGLSMETIQQGVLGFGGVKRRQDILGEFGGVLLMEDFAHHPTAVHETLVGLRLFYPTRRLIVAFEPRTNSSRRNVFQNHYARAFDAAELVCIKRPPGMEAIPASERLDVELLVEQIGERNKDARLFESAGELLEYLVRAARPNDLIVCMSNGSFDGLPAKLAEALRAKFGS
ncbi:MAG: UDP-N-acetylmuramate:L-alanyl-gamma-D-glutamyl-meso-diaminopimelate ligase, partial [Desulfobacteraceae bacterium]|nr:UDP-N-acetylmuramate:L-alanyl-gamma-D-glutamyl-meso-diaminopimelate ligase [Desulfobacteraceae bacterium]